METSANADGFYFSVRSTRPVLLTRVRVGLRDGTAPTTVRVAVIAEKCIFWKLTV